MSITDPTTVYEFADTGETVDGETLATKFRGGAWESAAETEADLRPGAYRIRDATGRVRTLQPTDVAPRSERPTADMQADDSLPEIPDESEFPSERAFQLFGELVFRMWESRATDRVLDLPGLGEESGESEGESESEGGSESEDTELSAAAETAQTDLRRKWNPSLHPRGPDGRFVKRPWSIPSDIRDLDTVDIIRELAQLDPDFISKIDGLTIDLPADEERSLHDIVSGVGDRSAGATAMADPIPDMPGVSTPETDDGPDIGTDPDRVIHETTPEKFAAAVESMIDADPTMGSFLTVHPPEELTEHTLLTAADGRVGAAISPDGDAQNLFNNDGPPGMGSEMVGTVADKGAITLDCYAGFLPELYEKYGFRETGRMEFNAEYAPEGWDFDRFGEPDVVFMAYQPDAPTGKSERYYEGHEWDQAKSDSRGAADYRHRSGAGGGGVGGGERGVDTGTGAAAGGPVDPTTGETGTPAEIALSDPVAYLDAFDEADYPDGGWTGSRFDNVEPGTVVQVMMDDYDWDGELAVATHTDSNGAKHLITETGEERYVTAEARTGGDEVYLTDVYDRGEWRAEAAARQEAEAAQREAAAAEQQEAAQQALQEREGLLLAGSRTDAYPYSLPATSLAAAPETRETYLRETDAIFASADLDQYDPDEQVAWAAEAVYRHFDTDDETGMEVNLAAATSLEQLRQTTADIMEIRDTPWALGLNRINFSTSDRLAKDMGEGFGEINAHFSPFSYDIFGKVIGDNPTIELNADKYHQQTTKSYGVFREDPRHSLWHELGHHNHFQSLRSEGYDWNRLSPDGETVVGFIDAMHDAADSDTIKDRIGDSVAFDPMEFYAEVFALRAADVDIPDDIQTAFDRVGRGMSSVPESDVDVDADVDVDTDADIDTEAEAG